MASICADSAGDEGMDDCQETSQLIPPQAKVQVSSNVHKSIYQSLSIPIDTSSLSGEQDVRDQNNQTGPPLPCESEVPEVIIENEHGMSESTSDLQCLMHILKGNIGTGVLAMPVAIKHAGLWTGCGLLLCIGALATHCMHLLVKSRKMISKRMGQERMSYDEVMKLCLKTGPPSLRRFSPAASIFVITLLVFTQLGFCCVYIVFISASIKSVVDEYTRSDVGVRIYELGVGVLLIPYCLVRDLRTLAPFSFFANILTGVGMVLIFVNITHGLPDQFVRPAFTSVAEMPLFFGTAIFAFEGISLVLPLESSIRDKHQFSTVSGVLNLAMVTVTCLYTAVGFYGYLRFGEAVEGSITLNLPNSPWYYMIVKPMFAISIFVSFNVQFYVPIRIFMAGLANCKCINMSTAKRKGRVESALRICLVLLTMALAMLVPFLEQLIALIGALASASLALILPAVIHIISLYGEPQTPGKGIIFKNSLIMLIGVIGCITGTYTAVLDLVRAVKEV